MRSVFFTSTAFIAVSLGAVALVFGAVGPYGTIGPYGPSHANAQNSGDTDLVAPTDLQVGNRQSITEDDIQNLSDELESLGSPPQDDGSTRNRPARPPSSLNQLPEGVSFADAPTDTIVQSAEEAGFGSNVEAGVPELPTTDEAIAGIQQQINQFGGQADTAAGGSAATGSGGGSGIPGLGDPVPPGLGQQPVGQPVTTPGGQVAAGGLTSFSNEIPAVPVSPFSNPGVVAAARGSVFIEPDPNPPRDFGPRIFLDPNLQPKAPPPSATRQTAVIPGGSLGNTDAKNLRLRGPIRRAIDGLNCSPPDLRLEAVPPGAGPNTYRLTGRIETPTENY
ncbi:MAG: hypothetical protein AAF556_08565, partial [Pseudomonadota bacterium]